MFLQERGYDITPVPNAEDGISLINKKKFDLVLLDEMLYGMDGLTALGEIKETNPSLPVIMITKSDGEALMEESIGSKIDDYLTKPVNPSQILLSCKKILDSKKIESERFSRNYTQEFSSITARLLEPISADEWINIYLKLTDWEVELDNHPELGLRQTLLDQKRDCNVEFARFIERNYPNWLQSENRPLLSMDLIPTHVLPLLEEGKKVVLIIVDNLRVDQWLSIEPLLYPYFQMNKSYYFSILPTATPYSRNAIFSGLTPMDIAVQHADIWEEIENDETSMNRYEHNLLEMQLKKRGLGEKLASKYIKVLDSKEAKSLYKNILTFATMPMLAVVFNFIDFLAHSRSESEVLKEIAPDEAAFRSLTRSWFEHSVLLKILRKMAKFGNTIIISSDHGSIRSLHGAKVIGDRHTSSNLRYKYGKSLKCESKYAVDIKNPADYKLPRKGINTNYLIAKEDYYFVYPTDYHFYLNQYKDTFQHGGISMEEMIMPVIKLEAK